MLVLSAEKGGKRAASLTVCTQVVHRATAVRKDIMCYVSKLKSKFCMKFSFLASDVSCSVERKVKCFMFPVTTLPCDKSFLLVCFTVCISNSAFFT